jgi:RluA family pseudouridine synthase
MDAPARKSSAHSIQVSSVATQEFWEIPLLYEDEHLLCLNKPAGLAVAPKASEPDKASLMALMHQGIASAKPWALARGLSFLMYAHRLDAEASGVLLFARTKAVLSRLLDLFGSGRAGISFVTLASGDAPQDQFSIEARLGEHPAKAGLMRIDSKYGKRARTNFETMERFRGWTLLRATPQPNRPHQVRVHLVRAGLRVAGDETYGGKPLWLSSLKPDYHLKPKRSERPLVERPCLHAEKISVPHPVTGAALVIEAPWPKDLLVAIKYLRKYAAG